MVRWAALASLVVAGGCGFTAVHDAGDLAGADLAGEDLAVPPGSDLAGADLAGVDLAGVDLRTTTHDLAQPACAAPILYVAVENLVNGAGGGGRVARLSLASDPPVACSTLSAQGLMTQQPFSVAQVGDKVAVEGIDSLQLLDPSTDTVVWTKPVVMNDFPVDVFPLDNPSGGTLVAAAWGSTNESPPLAITHVDAWAQDGSAVKSWALNAVDLPLGLNVLGMAANPKAPTHFLALDPINHAWGWDVDPWGAAKQALFGEATGNPITIATTTWSTEMRTVWVDASGQTDVFYNNDGNGPGILGPVACTGCTLLHAVPDPTINTRFFGLCDGPSVDARRVVRFSSGAGTCDTVLEGAMFGAQSRLSRLGLGQ
jgi:hypothetical protein